MKINKKSLVLYGAAALLLVPLVVGIGFLFADSVAEIMQKRRLANGVQIMATVTDQESRFNVVRGGGYNSYQIDYEFQYTDRQTGQLKKQVRADYPLYKKEYAAYMPGSTFVASFIPGEPNVSEPAATVGRLSPQAVLLSRLTVGLVFLGVIGALISRFPRMFERVRGRKRSAMLGVVLFAAVGTGLIMGGGAARAIENLLL